LYVLQTQAFSHWTFCREERGAAHRGVATYDRQIRRGEGTSGISIGEWGSTQGSGNIRQTDKKRRRDIRYVYRRGGQHTGQWQHTTDK